MGGRAEDRLNALADLLDVLRCPVCAATVDLLDMVGPAAGPRVLACAAWHRFDVAKQGHVVLVAGGSKLRADTADMVRARLRVMASGAFDDVRAGVVEVCRGGSARDGGDLVVDLGAGPGTWTAAVLDAAPDRRGLALELSVPALRAAARAHHRLGAVGADLTRPLPLVDGAVGDHGVVLAVFAPLATDDELRRVSLPGSRLVVVTPTPAHLAGLRRRLGLLDVPADKPERLQGRLAGTWQPTGRYEVSTAVRLDRALAADVVAMGPNAWHTDDRLRAALALLPESLDDTVAVTLSTFRRR